MPTRIALKRTSAGRYYATNGLDILDPAYVSASITREPDGGWITRYFVGSAAVNDPIKVWDVKLADARFGVAAVMAQGGDVLAWRVSAVHTQAVNDAIDAYCAAVRANIDRLKAELTGATR